MLVCLSAAAAVYCAAYTIHCVASKRKLAALGSALLIALSLGVFMLFLMR